MRPPVSYLSQNTSYHERTGDILTFAHFVEENLVENECNTEEYESISASIDESSIDNDSDDEIFGINALEDIWYESQIQPQLNTRYEILKILDHVRQTINEWRGA